jgi:hypothetical protein
MCINLNKPDRAALSRFLGFLMRCFLRDLRRAACDLRRACARGLRGGGGLVLRALRGLPHTPTPTLSQIKNLSTSATENATASVSLAPKARAEARGARAGCARALAAARGAGRERNQIGGQH